MNPHLQVRPPSSAASHLRRQDPNNYLRLLEAHLSALIDARDAPGWTINPAYHPDVMAFIQQYANNSGFVQKARAMQQNRAQFYARMRTSQQPLTRPTVLNTVRSTVVHTEPVPEAIFVATPVALPLNYQALPVATVIGPAKS